MCMSDLFHILLSWWPTYGSMECICVCMYVCIYLWNMLQSFQWWLCDQDITLKSLHFVHRIFIYSVWFLQHMSTILLYIFSRLVFVMQAHCSVLDRNSCLTNNVDSFLSSMLYAQLCLCANVTRRTSGRNLGNLQKVVLF
jgi:hypothetical protein